MSMIITSQKSNNATTSQLTKRRNKQKVKFFSLANIEYGHIFTVSGNKLLLLPKFKKIIDHESEMDSLLGKFDSINLNSKRVKSAQPDTQSNSDTQSVHSQESCDSPESPESEKITTNHSIKYSEPADCTDPSNITCTSLSIFLLFNFEKAKIIMVKLNNVVYADISYTSLIDIVNKKLNQIKNKATNHTPIVKNTKNINTLKYIIDICTINNFQFSINMILASGVIVKFTL